MIFSKKLKSIIGAFCVLVIISACGGESTTGTKETAAKINTTTPNTAVTTSTVSAKKVIIGGKDMSAKSGEEFCMDVKVSNFVDIISIQYSMNWDAAALEYINVKSFSIKDLNAESFGKPKEEPNSLRFLWFSTDIKPVSLFNDATIYQVCFKAIGKSGTTTPVKITNKPISVEVANSNYVKVEHELRTATITIE